MKHEERVSLAKDILNRIQKKYGDKIHVGGIYGSVARGDDTELSDLDMILIRKNNTEDIHNEFLFEGIPVSYRSMKLKEAEDTIQNPDFGWPWSVNSMVNFKVVIGNKKVQAKLKKRAENVSIEKLKEATRKQLPNIYEYYFKVNKYSKNNEKNNLLFAMWDLLNGLLGCVALLNKEYFVRNDFYRFEESFDYNKTPENYEKLVKKCYTSKKPEEIKKSVNELFNNFKKFMNENGIKINKYSDTDNIEI